MVKGYQLIEDESLLDALCRGYGSLLSAPFCLQFLFGSPHAGRHFDR